MSLRPLPKASVSRVTAIETGILFTDHYQLTMAQLYLRMGLADRRATFDAFFRSYPDYGSHQAGYCIAAGLSPLVEWMGRTRFGPAECQVLESITGSTGDRVFDDGFIGWLEDMDGFSSIEMVAVPEGRAVHPNTPIAIVRGPIGVAQLLETSLLNHINYPTLIATKASRVVEAAQGAPVLEFGMRRGPAVGANSGTRAALIGGVGASSNVGMSHVLGVESSGTHAHSMVQAFMAVAGGEKASFEAYAEVYPDDCLLLVDTIDTLESGVPNAIEVFEDLRRRGHRPVGIRLDSGDLAHLAVRSASMLDAAGFDDVSIVISSGLDELTIWQIRNQITVEAPRYDVDADHLLARLVFGVGSKMVTSEGDPSLGGVYKLVALEDENGVDVPAIKISDTPEKIQNPGVKQLVRIYDERGTATADLIGLDEEDLTSTPLTLKHPTQPGVERTVGPDGVSEIEPLLEPAFAGGRSQLGEVSVERARERRTADIERLDPGVRRLVNPHTYHVSLSAELDAMKRRLIDRWEED